MLPWGETNTGEILLFNQLVEMKRSYTRHRVACSATTHVHAEVSVVTAGETTIVNGVAYYFNGSIIRSKILTEYTEREKTQGPDLSLSFSFLRSFSLLYKTLGLVVQKKKKKRSKKNLRDIHWSWQLVMGNNSDWRAIGYSTVV